MPTVKTMDGNTAVSHIAYAFSDAAAIYPITPSSPMAETVDLWASQGKKNLFGQRVQVTQLQSEAGAAGTLHGLACTGALATTFTASQGLLLMIPVMYKLAGELLPAVFHVSARALSTHALSIFGDHSDVMACRQTGFAMLCASSVQEAADMALVAHMATLESRVPFLHFFDGFRTSHEIQKVELPDEDTLRALMPWEALEAFRRRAMDPEHPHQRGTAQNPDVYFQNREAANRFYQAVPGVVEACMGRVGEATGRAYRLFDYAGSAHATRVLVMMGSGAETAEETVMCLNRDLSEKVGVVKVRLYRPFCAEAFLRVLPDSVERIAVLDRTKESGSLGEPLYLDVCAALKEAGRDNVKVIGGRYGLGGKDFTPGQAKAVFDNLRGPMKHPFTVGISDDVTGLSLPVNEDFRAAPESTVACKLYGFGSDGTVGASKMAVKLIGDHTEKYVQAFFSYDSRKSGGLTVSHLRFGDWPIRSAYPADQADYVACHNPAYVEQYDMVDSLRTGGVFLLNCPWEEDELEQRLPARLRRALARKKARLYLINAGRIAELCALGGRISGVMLAAFFRLTEALPLAKALTLMKDAAAEMYKKQGEEVVRQNRQAITLGADAVHQVQVPAAWAELPEEKACDEDVIRTMLSQRGDSLPVSAFDPGGVVPTATSRLEKRGIAPRVPQWIPERCIQCGLCTMVCPHACIRGVKASHAPADVATIPLKGKDSAGMHFRVQVSPYDCTGCTNCAKACPVNALVMQPFDSQKHQQKNWDWAMGLPQEPCSLPGSVKDAQFLPPLFEFSGACAGCGETPYIRLLTQLFGDRMLIANATGCSSIYGGSAPTCPYSVNHRGHGPAWANSLFENNAEFGLGMHLALTQRRAALAAQVRALEEETADEVLRAACGEWLGHMQEGEASRKAGERLRALCEADAGERAQKILQDTSLLTKKSVWMIGGDGWAYDIGFGGLDHVLSLREDVNILVLDTEVYSNTGGQMSKATPAGALAKFAASGKDTPRKDLGRMAMTWGHVYVAQVSMGANPQQLLRAMTEAESYPGPSLVIAYAPCINHGISMADTQQEMRRAVESGYWQLYRYDPRRETPLTVDSRPPTLSYEEFLQGETRYAALLRQDPDRAAELFRSSEEDARRRRSFTT